MAMANIVTVVFSELQDDIGLGKVLLSQYSHCHGCAEVPLRWELAVSWQWQPTPPHPEAQGGRRRVPVVFNNTLQGFDGPIFAKG